MLDELGQHSRCNDSPAGTAHDSRCRFDTFDFFIADDVAQHLEVQDTDDSIAGSRQGHVVGQGRFKPLIAGCIAFDKDIPGRMAHLDVIDDLGLEPDIAVLVVEPGEPGRDVTGSNAFSAE